MRPSTTRSARRRTRLDRRQPAFGFDDDHAEHPVGDVVQHRLGAAVVHPHPGVVGGELVDELLARGDRAHLVVPRHLRGVVVDRVRHLRLRRVDQVHPDGVTHLRAQHRAGHRARRTSTPAAGSPRPPSSASPRPASSTSIRSPPSGAPPGDEGDSLALAALGSSRGSRSS